MFFLLPAGLNPFLTVSAKQYQILQISRWISPPPHTL